MPTLIDQGIEIVEEAGGVRYRLPGASGALGCGLTGCGSFLLVIFLGCAAALLPCLVLVIEKIWASFPPGWAVLATGLVLILFSVPAWFYYKTITWLAAFTFGKFELRYEQGMISAGLRWWFIRKESRPPIRGTVRLLYVPYATEKPARGTDLSQYGRLVAETLEGKRIEICSGTHGLLQVLASQLADRCQLPTGTGSIESSQPVRLPVEEVSVVRPFEGCRRLPGGRLVIEAATDGVTLIVPPVGVWHASRWRFVGTLLGAAVCSTITIILVAVELKRDDPFPNFICIPMSIWGCGWLVSTGLLLDCVIRGSQRAVIAVVGGRLLYHHGPSFWSTREEWGRAQVADIRQQLAPLARKGRDDWVLRIETTDGRSHFLLLGYPKSDLHWIATELRLALGLPVIFAEGK